jgi:hypothetical protein
MAWGHGGARYILGLLLGRGAAYHIADWLHCVIKAHAVLIYHAQGLLESLFK